jgi:hypothetical protein
MVEVAGVELFHILWFLQLADSKKETKYSKAYFAGAIVRVSYTENLANLAEMHSVTRGFLHLICRFRWRVVHFRQCQFELFERTSCGTSLQVLPIGALPVSIIGISIVHWLILACQKRSKAFPRSIWVTQGAT